MLKQHYMTTEESFRSEEPVREPEQDVLQQYEAETPGRKWRIHFPTWLTRLMSRRTRMNQQFQLSDKSGWE